MIYLSQCNFRCPFCHNSNLVLSKPEQPLKQEQLLKAILQRRGFIDGVVITGGEPTLHSEIVELITAINRLGFTVKLDTNGYKPEVIESVIASGHVSYIAMDIKTSLHKYKDAAGIDIDITRLIKSIALIKDSNINHEFRTTCVPGLVNKEDIENISQLVGSKAEYTLQQFQPKNTLDTEFSKIPPYTLDTLVEFMKIARKNAGQCRLIGT